MLGEEEQVSQPQASAYDGYGGLVLNSHLLDASTQEREMVCHSIPSSGRISEFWDMIFSNKWTTVVVLRDTAKGKKEVIVCMFYVYFSFFEIEMSLRFVEQLHILTINKLHKNMVKGHILPK